MAKIVLGIGCAHTPQLHTPADKWDIRGKRDTEDGVAFWYKGERLKYARLAEIRAEQNLDEQTGMEIREERLTKSFEAIEQLSKIYAAAAKPDVTIIFGNDQAEMFLDDIKPAFTIWAARNSKICRVQKRRLRDCLPGFNWRMLAIFLIAERLFFPATRNWPPILRSRQ